MKIVVNHITRMEAGYICVAGVDLKQQKHVRPVLRGRLPSTLLKVHGGPFGMAAIVDLGNTAPAGSPPEIEDRAFNDAYTSFETRMKPDEFWKLLKTISGTKLQTIFGSDISKKYSGSAVVPLGQGIASLGCLYPAQIGSIHIRSEIGNSGKPKNKIRLEINDPDLGYLDLSVTDIRLYKGDHVTADEGRVTKVNKRLRSGVNAVLSVGLTRPFPPSGPVHWLQLSNIHLEDDPGWDL